jgi:hypothetical protein
MDLVTVTGNKSVSELFETMDTFEYNCWFRYWQENMFGPFANNYLHAQSAGSSAHAFGGGKWSVHDYMATAGAKAGGEDFAVDTEEAMAREQAVTYQVMCEFGGKEKADQWRAGINGNN